MVTSRTDRAGWLIDEVGAAGRENLDEAHVARYDTIEDSGADAEVRLLAGLGLDPGSVVVDLGAGTGQFALAVAPHCARVVAVDVSPPMLRLLQRKVGGRDNVEVVQAGFLSYEHRGRPPDVVYTRYALHHLPDFWKGVALARLYDVLKPGGVLRVWDVVYHFDPGDAEAGLAAWCASGAAGGAEGWSRSDYEEHIRDEHSTFTWLFEAMATRAGFLIEAADYSADGIFAKYVLRRPAQE